MKRILAIVSAALLLASCASVLSRKFMQEGAREVRLDRLRETPEIFKDKLFILGGMIAHTRITAQGSELEALYVPVDSYGYLKEDARIQGRFIAIYPKAAGLLDPVIYKRGREVTIAAEFVEIRKGKIDEMDYAYPVFHIRQIHLWPEPKDYYYAPYYPYPYYYPYPFRYDRWGRPYPDPFWPPPW